MDFESTAHFGVTKNEEADKLTTVRFRSSDLEHTLRYHYVSKGSKRTQR